MRYVCVPIFKDDVVEVGCVPCSAPVSTPVLHYHRTSGHWSTVGNLLWISHSWSWWCKRPWGRVGRSSVLKMSYLAVVVESSAGEDPSVDCGNKLRAVNENWLNSRSKFSWVTASLRLYNLHLLSWSRQTKEQEPRYLDVRRTVMTECVEVEVLRFLSVQVILDNCASSSENKSFVECVELLSELAWAWRNSMLEAKSDVSDFDLSEVGGVDVVWRIMLTTWWLTFTSFLPWKPSDKISIGIWTLCWWLRKGYRGFHGGSSCRLLRLSAHRRISIKY